jgi:hypothetical protein
LAAGGWSLDPLDQATDELGRRVDTLSVPTTPAGYQNLLAWARGLGEPIAWGVDGTGILLGSDGRSLGRVTDRMSMSVGPFTTAGRRRLVDVGGVLRRQRPRPVSPLRSRAPREGMVRHPGRADGLAVVPVGWGQPSRRRRLRELGALRWGTASSTRWGIAIGPLASLLGDARTATACC